MHALRQGRHHVLCRFSALTSSNKRQISRASSIIASLSRSSAWKNHQSKAPSSLRMESTDAIKARRPGMIRNFSQFILNLFSNSITAAIYPELLNVYRPPANATVWVGCFRVITIGVFLFGSIYFTSAVYFSPDHSNWLVPLVPLYSAIPMVVMAFTSGPMVHSIKVWLPSWARRSRQDFQRFASNVPPDVKLQVSFMKFRPWPQTRELRFGDLRRLRPSWREGIANMEHVPESVKPHQGSFWFRLVRGYHGKYYVRRSLVRDKSAAPGVWDEMWQQIPEAGQKEALKRVEKAERPVYAVNVSPSSSTGVSRSKK